MNLLQRLAGAVIGIALFVAAFIFTSVILTVAAVIALTAWAWMWWRTRGLRRAAARADGTVIEGEYRVEREVHRLDNRDDSPRP